jgi:hypothetical protein
VSTVIDDYQPEVIRSILADATDRDVLIRIWAALRSIGIGAPLDMDYAKVLAERLDLILFKS